MKRFLPFLFLVFSAHAAFSQCLLFNTSVSAVSCYNGTDGRITINVTNGVGPFTYELYLFRPGFGETPMGSVSTASTTVTFQQGNGTLSPLFESTGIRANASLNPPGNQYRVFVSASGMSGDPFCETLGQGGIMVTQPPQIVITLNDIDPDCNPSAGIGNGKIDVTVSGGTGAYTIIWSGPTAIADGTLVTGSNLDAGSYSVAVTDENGCSNSLNIALPVVTSADAGPATGLTCGTNSFVLAGNTPGAGETGTWTGPPGITFSPNANTPNATANNLNAGSNILRWTIDDSGGVCAGTFDEIDVVFSPAINLSTTLTNVLCKGASTGAIDLNIAGGISPFTYAWNNGSTSQDLTNVPAGTYSVTVTDGASCTETLNNLTISEPATGVSGTTTQVDVTCFGANTGSITITGTGGVGPYDFSIDGGASYPISDLANHTFSALTAGTYNLMVRDVNACETAVIPVTITQPAAPLSASTTQVDVLCFGGATGSITITGAGGVAPYDFSIDGGASYPALNAADHTFTGLAAATYNLMVRDVNGCEIAVPVTINQPAATVSGTTTEVDVTCFGETTGSITITGTGGTGPYDFSIDGGAAYPITDLANHTFSGLAAGTYNLMVRDAGGCTSNIISATISEPAAVVTGSTASVDVTCFGESTGSITITGAGGVAPYDFSIDGGATYPISDLANHTFSALAAGIHNIRVRDANGCQSVVIPVTINQPAAAVSANTTQVDVTCFGASTGSITITGAGGVSPYDFSIDGGATYPISDVADHTFAGLSDGTYNLMARDANGCETAVIPVTINEPAAAVSGNTTQVDVTCFGASTGSITIAGAGGVAPYDFSIDGGSTYPMSDAADHTFAGLAAGTYNLMVRDASGCISAAIPVTVSQPSAAVNGSTTQVDVACFAASTGAITITGTGGTSPYDFSIDGGTAYPANDVAAHTFAGLSAGTYNLVVRDAGGCQSVVIPVTINQPAAAVTGTISKVDVSCFGGTTGSITITGAGGVAPYDFSIDGGATYPASDVADHTFSALAAGTYNLMVRDANNCISSSTAVAILEPAEVTAAISAVGAITVCSGSVLPDIIFTFTGVGPFDFTYTDGTTPVNVTDHNAGTYTIASAPAGTYSVSALSDNNGCVSANMGGSVTVTVEPAATAEAGAMQTICSGGTATLSGSSVGGSATTGAWTVVSQPASGDGVLSDLTQTATPSTVTFSATVAGSYILRLTTNDPAGICEADTDDVTVTVSASATVSAGVDATICEGSSVTLTGTATGTSGITWSSASGDGVFDDVNLANATYTPGSNDIAAGAVTLTITTAGPCASVQDEVTITIAPVPTVDAGAPQVICSSGFIILNASFGGSATGLLWTTSGDGTFDDTTDPNARYTPGSLDSTNTTVTLTATATGSCAGFDDGVAITVNPAATVDAGNPQTVCFGSNVTLNATLGGAATTLTWTTSGDGVFSNNTDPAAVYTPGANDRTAGTVTLTATTNNPAGPCPSTNDNVAITLIPIPGDQTTAGNESWIGYVYDDAGDVTPIPAKIDFDNAKYRGFIGAADMDNMSGASTYNAATDEFDLNLTLVSPVQGPNVCGSYLNFFSVRYTMNKAFAEGVYRFTISGDDGVRLLIDGVNVIPATAFALHAYTTFVSEPICLTAGVHSFEIHYFDNTAQSRLTFEYEAVPELDVTTPVTVCINSPTPTLTVSSTDADVVDFNWYKNGALVFTGANYTPAPGELNMAAAATTTFEVTAVYACGETPPTDVVVTIVNAASLVINPQTVCESGGVVDLTTLVDETPAGGTFVFSGHVNISGNNFDPSGLAGNTVPITVNYSNGSCVAPEGTLNLTITNSAVVTVPAANVITCANAPDIDLTTLVSASPSGGAFTFAGASVSGNYFDPSGLSGSRTMTVNYSVGGCVAAQTTFEIEVTNGASVSVNNSTVCQNSPAVNLLTLVTPTPAGGTFTFSGTGVTGNSFNPAGQSGTVNVTVDYDFNGCTDNRILQISVLNPSDPLCTGGNCTSVVIVPKPEPATCTNSDGRLVMSLKPFTPAINNTGVRITIDGISSTGLAISRTIYNDSTFTALPVGSYNYSIEYGDPSCIKTGQFSIDQSGTVGTPVVSNVISPVCVGSATGSLTLDVPGETGNILEWSLDGGLTDPFKPFTAGAQISGIPAGPAPSFQQVISVRRNIADVCYSSVTVVVNESVQTIGATFDIIAATCNGNDGGITNIVASGGNGGPYTYSLDGGQNFQSGASFSGLAGGAYALLVRDASGCENDFTANVTFPGFINSAISKNNANCTNGGNSGSISVTVNDPGVFEVALSTDQFNQPEDSQYLAYNNPSVSFNSLGRGQYFVYVKSSSAGCPTRSAPINIFGVYDITFDLVPDCNDNEMSLAFQNVTGEAGGAPLEIQVSKKLSSDPPEIIYQQFPADGEIYLDHDQYTFLQTPGEYSIKIIQFQNEVVCNFSSESVDFSVPTPLVAQTAAVSESYPDIPTGRLNVRGFTGGEYPYSVRIELDSASSVSLPSYFTDFEEAGLDENQQTEMAYRNIPAGRYQVEVMDSLGCTINFIARVPLDADLFIPNVFTPNGDGSNDHFFIRNLPSATSINQLMISNRWGKEVFNSENYQNNWEAEGVADGIYFYRLKVGDNDPLTGWVEVIRGPKP